MRPTIAFRRDAIKRASFGVAAMIPMPNYMAEQMPSLMPKVMDNLMPHMLPDLVPLAVPKIISFLLGRG
jgi:hypothetical protein